MERRNSDKNKYLIGIGWEVRGGKGKKKETIKVELRKYGEKNRKTVGKMAV